VIQALQFVDYNDVLRYSVFDKGVPV
jgi:hypothetical protein